MDTVMNENSAMPKTIEQFNAEGDAELQEAYSQLSEEIKEKTEKRIVEFYREHPDELGDILNMIKEETQRYLGEAFLETDEDPSDEFLRARINKALNVYMDLLKETAPDKFLQANEFIENCIIGKKYIAIEWEKKLKTIEGASSQRRIPSVKTKTPKDHITTTDKLSRTAFAPDNNEIYRHKQIALRVSPKNSKKEINTLLSIRFDELEEEGISMKRLTPFDRAVYDAIMTLYVEGGNHYMSIEMVHRIMVGNPKARVMEKQGEAIKHSIRKMMHTVITIDATEEGKAYKQNDYFLYTGNLLYAEMVETSLNGNVVNALHIVHEPVLYSHASRTNKIGRISLALFDTPVSKNAETIIIQDYLARRILAMKGSDKLSKSITYESIYQQVSLNTADSPSEGALRKKKADIRKKVKAILDYWEVWKDPNGKQFIRGYEEKNKGQALHGIVIKI